MIKQNWNIDTKEVKRILMMHESATKNLYLIKEQNTSNVQSSTNPDEITLEGKSFFSNGKWKSLSPEGKEELDSQLSNAAKFLTSKKGRVVYVKIIAGESQVTNTDNEDPARPKVDPGYLSEKRATTMKEYLTKYFDNLVSQGIISSKPIFEAPEVIIGSEKYTKGIDNPNDEKYKPERFVKVELKLKSPADCVVGLTVEVMYNSVENTRFPCRGDHRCNEAEFAIKLNGVEIGIANLNNEYDGKSKTSGPIVVTDEQAKQIIGDKSKDIIISLQCLSGDKCHSSSPEVKISKGNSVIYWGCSPSLTEFGDTADKIILVLDNCGNLKKKGTETENKGDEKTPINVKPTGKVLEFPIGVTTDMVERVKFLSDNKFIKSTPEKDGSYLVIHNRFGNNHGVSLGDRVKLVKKPLIKFIKCPINETPESLGKSLMASKTITPVTDKRSITIPTQDVYKVLQNVLINKVTYKEGDYIKLVK